MLSKPERKKRARPIVRWHGGKWMIRQWILQFIPERHDTYVEPFGGGASILLSKPRAQKAEIYNDLDETLWGLFHVLQDSEKAARLIQLLEMTPYSRKEFLDAYEPTDDPVERARRTLVRSWMGYGSDGTAGVYKTGFRNVVNQAGKTPAGEWVNFRATLPLTIDRLQGVCLEQKDAFRVMEQFDAPSTVHYVDPPYLPETRSAGNRRRGAGYHVYQHELSTEDHVRLLELLRSLEGMVILSGYPSKLYDEALTGWRREQRIAYADGAGQRTEVVWINPRCAAALEADDAPPLLRDV